MKKIKTPKRIISSLLVITLATTLSGCALMPFYWNGMSKWQCEKYATDKLKEKYNEDFKVLEFIHTGSGELLGACVPVRDENLVFNIELEVFKEVEVSDEYIEAIVRAEAFEYGNEILTKYYGDNYVFEVALRRMNPNQGSGLTDPSQATIENYTEAYPEKNSFFMWIAFDKNKVEPNPEEFEPVIEELIKKCHKARILLDCHFTNDEVITECKKQIAANHMRSGHEIESSIGVLLDGEFPFYSYWGRYENGEQNLQLIKTVGV